MNVEQIAPFTACLMGLPDPRIISIVGGGGKGGTFKTYRKETMSVRRCTLQLRIEDGWRWCFDLNAWIFFFFFLIRLIDEFESFRNCF